MGEIPGEVTDWRDEAACRGMDPNLFYPDRGESVTRALETCGSCPVREPCAEAGRFETMGVWGGTTGRQRKSARARAGVVQCVKCGDGFDRDGHRVCPGCREREVEVEVRMRRWREARQWTSFWNNPGGDAECG